MPLWRSNNLPYNPSSMFTGKTGQALIVCLLALLVLSLAACSREEATPVVSRTASAATATSSPTRVTPRATTTATPTALPPTVTPTHTPRPPPQVIAADQVLEEEGAIVIERVVALQPGWLVLHADDDGNVGPILGHAAVDAGENEGVEIAVDPLQATERLYAVLHVDRGRAGRYEFPGADEPVEHEGEVVMAAFEVEVEVALPAIRVSDQEVDETFDITVDEVVAPEPAWLVIYADEGGEPGAVVGLAPLEAGRSQDLPLRIDRRLATPRLYAALHLDTAEPGRYEYPDADPPVLVAGEPVSAPFAVLLPPDVVVYDQPVIDGQVIVERAVSDGPGWIVLYSDENGQLGLIAGYAPLPDGISEHIPVPLNESALTDTLRAMIHRDTGEIGAFEYPSGDPLVRYADRMLIFSFEIDTGNFVVTRDQPLEEGVITLPKVVVNVPAWAIIRIDEDGAPGAIIGQEALPAGYHNDVRVAIDAEQATDLLYVTLHADQGDIGDFDPAEDTPLEQGGNEITAPFSAVSSQ